MTDSQITALLQEVLHPGKQSRNIVELGMVGKITNQDKHITVELLFGPNRDPLQEYLIGATRAALIRGCKDSTIEVTSAVQKSEPKPAKKKLELDNSALSGVKHIIGVASGKGGVGKSTVAVGLACALARAGYKVGLADADVYGPSIPTMTGTEGFQPIAEGEQEENALIIPAEKYGVKWMSIGYFTNQGQALIWRGPMACSALKQMILQVKWGELDFLLIDMPPGTGDIHISLVQDIPMESAIIVTTPGKVAIEDVRRGISLFRNQNVSRPILGVVENMAWFTPAEHPDEKYYIFGRDGGERMAEELGLKIIGQIPLVQSVREDADSGVPSALGSGPESLPFLELAGKVVNLV